MIPKSIRKLLSVKSALVVWKVGRRSSVLKNGVPKFAKNNDFPEAA